MRRGLDDKHRGVSALEEELARLNKYCNSHSLEILFFCLCCMLISLCSYPFTER